MKKNLFCDKSSLTNEAAVEQFFISKLLDWLGYSETNILPKTSIEDLKIGKGSKKLHYKPDYVLVSALLTLKSPRWIIDAKSPSENIDNWIEQCASYCLSINRRLPRADGVRYFMLSNGLMTKVYAWDRDEPELTLTFDDFVKGSKKMAELKELLGEDVVSSWAPPSPSPSPSPSSKSQELFHFERPSPAAINAVFAACNNYIYKHDNISPASAFHEFVKLIFLKIRADRALHKKFPTKMVGMEPIPIKEVSFSVHRIEALEANYDNPMDSQFSDLLHDLEKEIRQGSKKRIFEADERLRLQSDTVKAVVRLMEHYDLYAIDEDLNGRMFETFLNSTMRGRELGQYFTPRSVVKLMIGLADLRANKDHIDKTIDPCCGTGGFLIEAMAVMEKAINGNGALSAAEKKKLLKELREESIFGIDVGRDPPIARIARINMYLHGDGGSRIYIAEALDKGLEHQGRLNPETEAEVAELREFFTEHDASFDAILTNPPFSKEYDPKVESNRKILRSYDVGGSTTKSQPMRSSILFLERYRDLVRPGGKVLAVIDDSLLGGRKYGWVREFIREHFIVRAVISLPGDAFQRSGARVKTSIIYLTRRESDDEERPDVFMWYCTAVGVDDSARQRVTPDDAARKEAAVKEVEAVVAAFRAAQAGTEKTYMVPAEMLKDRLDVKSCVLKPGRKNDAWKSHGLTVGPVKQWVTPREEPSTAEGEETVRQFSVRYDGQPGEPEEMLRETIKSPALYVVRTGDLVVSHINAVNGAICVIPDELDGAVVSSEYTVLTPKEGVSPYALWAILRSPEIRADFLTRASGLGRTRIDLDVLLSLPIPSPTDKQTKESSQAFAKALELEAEARRLRAEAQQELEKHMDLTSEAAERIILAFKPPR